MALSKILGFAFFVTILQFSSCDLPNSIAPQSIQWVSVSQSEAVLIRPEPAGIEHGKPLYVCNVFSNKRHYVGKLQMNEGEVQCMYAKGGQTKKSGKFKMLRYHPGTLDWIPLAGNRLDYGVKIQSNLEMYVCRVFHNKEHIIPGTLAGNACYYEHNGERMTDDASKIEFLQISLYAYVRRNVQTF